MSRKLLLSPDVLRQLLEYHPDTGKLFWRSRDPKWFSADRYCQSWNTRYSGTEAFTAIGYGGYLHGAIFDTLYKAHTVAWVLYYGSFPKTDTLDHVDGDVTNNKLDNLREASFLQNSQNKKVSKANKLGVKGVYFDAKRSKFRAQIKVSGKQMMLGYFADLKSADDAYRLASRLYHGDFSRA